MKLQIRRVLPGLLALSIAALPVSAPAQSGPAAETITGTVSTVNDADTIDVNDARGFVDSVRLQQDTVIFPSGSRIEPGMAITIVGVNRGKFFAANQITISNPAGAAPPQQPFERQPAPPGPDTSHERPNVPPLLANAGDLTGSIGTALDSKNAYVGETIQLLNVASADGSIRDATLYGTVIDVERPSQGHSAQLEMHFDRLRLADGTAFRIEGVVTQMQVSTKNNALKEAGGALAGMLAGNAIAKTLFGISGGGLLGAVGGYFIAKDNRTDVTVPANSAVSVRLVQARRQTQ